MPLKTQAVTCVDDVRAFFDRIAGEYREAHGHSERLLSYRLDIIKGLLGARSGVLLEIGCGTGLHLFRLTQFFDKAIGTDLSPGMIGVAERLRESHPLASSIEFYVDRAEELTTITENAIDTVLCVGVLEHIPDKAAVLRQVARVLKPGGEWVCLTPNGDYCWYQHISRWFGLETRHLSSDYFINRPEFHGLLHAAGLQIEREGYWTFIPKGDMPILIAKVLPLLDTIGKVTGLTVLRGGLYVRAVKPCGPECPADAQ